MVIRSFRMRSCEMMHRMTQGEKIKKKAHGSDIVLSASWARLFTML